MRYWFLTGEIVEKIYISQSEKVELLLLQGKNLHYIVIGPNWRKNSS